MAWPILTQPHAFLAQVNNRGRTLEILFFSYWLMGMMFFDLIGMLHIKLYRGSIFVNYCPSFKLVTISVPSCDNFLFPPPHLLLLLVRIFFNYVLPPCYLHGKSAFSCTLILNLASRQYGQWNVSRYNTNRNLKWLDA